MHSFLSVLLYNTMKRKRLTPSFGILFGAVLLFTFSGLWHPLLHHACGHHEKQELAAPLHACQSVCAVCLGILQSDEPESFSFKALCEKPADPVPAPARHCPDAIPREHTPRAPPAF